MKIKEISKADYAELTAPVYYEVTDETGETFSGLKEAEVLFERIDDYQEIAIIKTYYDEIIIYIVNDDEEIIYCITEK